MRRRANVVLAIIGVAVVAVVVGLVSLVRRGFSTHDEPGALESLVARSVRHWSVPAGLRDATNPLPASGQVLADARAHWADHCALCHGDDGRGRTTIGQRLYPRAPDLTLPATQELADGELYAIIENGIRLTGMPGWGDGNAESGYGSWALVHFMRRLPHLASEEVSAMEALDPTSAEEWEQMLLE